MTYDKPIINGSTEWLRAMREMEAEAYDDGDTYIAAHPETLLVKAEALASALPLCSAPTLATRESLLAAFATTMDANRPAADRPLSAGDQTPLLMVWGWW